MLEYIPGKRKPSPVTEFEWKIMMRMDAKVERVKLALAAVGRLGRLGV